uniref:ParM/StbA family protein n=1 Tax=Aeromonas sp. Y318-3 TaxID=2990509 RepID=UPI0022E08646
MTKQPAEKPNIQLVAVDDGSGNINVAYTDAEGFMVEYSQPSLVEADVAASMADELNGSVWTTSDHNYTVRRTTQSPISTLAPDYQISDASRVLVVDTLVKAKLGGQLLAIGCTLPVNQYYKGKTGGDRLNEERIKAKQASLKKAVTSTFGAAKPPRILSVSVYPEALTAYYYCAYGARPGEDVGKYPDVHTTLVVDLGEFTCDLAIITTGNEIQDIATYEHGVHRMVERFHALLMRDSIELGLPDLSNASSPTLKTLIERGYIGSNATTPDAIAKRIDVTRQINEAADSLNELILDGIHKILRVHEAVLTRVVFVGGGAHLLREHAKAWPYVVDI